MESANIKITAETIYEWLYSGKIKEEKLYMMLPKRKKKRGMAVRKSKRQPDN